MRVDGVEHIPASGPSLITINHYTSPTLFAAWLALTVSAVTPVDVRWGMTAGWRFEDGWVGTALSAASAWAFRRVARAYSLELLPPIPADPRQSEERAAAVRRLSAYARQAQQPMIGLAPEGRDFPGGQLGWPAPGAGRMMLHLGRLGLVICPVGAYEEQGAVCLRFGPHYRLEVGEHLSNGEQDTAASRMVMERIAALVPEKLRGEFA